MSASEGDFCRGVVVGRYFKVDDIYTYISFFFFRSK